MRTIDTWEQEEEEYSFVSGTGSSRVSALQSTRTTTSIPADSCTARKMCRSNFFLEIRPRDLEMVQVTVEYREYNTTLDVAREQNFTLPLVPYDPLDLMKQIDIVESQNQGNNLVILTAGLDDVPSDSLLVLDDNQEYLYHQQKLYTRSQNDSCVYDSTSGKGIETFGWWMNQFKVISIPISNVQIEVKTLTGKTLSIALPIYSTTAFLKELIQDREGSMDCASFMSFLDLFPFVVPPDQQQLRYAGNEMTDTDRLLDHHIRSGSVVYLLLRLRGGMYLPPSARDGWEHLLLQNINGCPAPAPPIAIKVTIECPYQPDGIFQLQLT
jgi:hypothetical protein